LGAALGYVNFRVIIGVLEPRLRALDDSTTPEARAVFERKLGWLRRIFLALEILIVGAIGYGIGAWLGS
jgi:hypothetical protein